MRYTFAPGDLVVFHCADSQRTPVLGVTILYAVLWFVVIGFNKQETKINFQPNGENNLWRKE